MGACASRPHDISIRTRSCTQSRAPVHVPVHTSEPTPPEGYTLVRKLGHGGEGETYLARETCSGALYALKFVRRSPKLNTRHVLAEIRIQSGLRHASIVQLHEVILSPTHLILRLQYIPGATLSEFVKSIDAHSPTQLLPEPFARFLFKQLLAALLYCHAQNVAHRDLKLSNIIVDTSASVDAPRLMLCDFGLSTDSTTALGMHRTYTTVGTRQYMSIEMLENQVTKKGLPYHPDKVDVWGLGVVLYILLAGRLPFSSPKGTPNTKFDVMLAAVKHGHFALCREECNSMFHRTSMSAECRSLIESMMQLDETKRADLSEVLNHSWTRGPVSKDHDAMLCSLAQSSQQLEASVTKVSRPSESYKQLQRIVQTAASTRPPVATLSEPNTMDSPFCAQIITRTPLPAPGKPLPAPGKGTVRTPGRVLPASADTTSPGAPSKATVGTPGRPVPASGDILPSPGLNTGVSTRPCKNGKVAHAVSAHTPAADGERWTPPQEVAATLAAAPPHSLRSASLIKEPSSSLIRDLPMVSLSDDGEAASSAHASPGKSAPGTPATVPSALAAAPELA